MGAFDEFPPVTIPANDDERKAWRWEPHEQVILKGCMDVSDQAYVANHYGQASKSGDIAFQVGTGRYSLLHRMIIGWTFTRNGQPVPLTTANIDKLPSRYSVPILEAIDKIASGMSEEEQSDFLNSAAAPTSEH